MIRYARLVYAGLAWLFVAAIVFQVFLIGLALFGDPEYRHTHAGVGFLIFFVVLALLIAAIVARPGRRDIGLVALLLVLYIVQISLPGARADYPAIAALHPVNALLMFGLGIQLARRATVLARYPTHDPAL
jgi:uncharacterized membrane protein YoaK (UPF0700 family)